MLATEERLEVLETEVRPLVLGTGAFLTAGAAVFDAVGLAALSPEEVRLLFPVDLAADSAFLGEGAALGEADVVVAVLEGVEGFVAGFAALGEAAVVGFVGALGEAGAVGFDTGGFAALLVDLVAGLAAAGAATLLAAGAVDLEAVFGLAVEVDLVAALAGVALAGVAAALPALNGDKLNWQQTTYLAGEAFVAGLAAALVALVALAGLVACGSSSWRFSFSFDDVS